MPLDAAVPRDSLDTCDSLYSFRRGDSLDASASSDGLCLPQPRDAPSLLPLFHNTQVGEPRGSFQGLGRVCAAVIGAAESSSERYSRHVSNGSCQALAGGGDPDREAALAAEVEVLQRQVDHLQLALHDAEDRHSRELAALVEVCHSRNEAETAPCC